MENTNSSNVYRVFYITTVDRGQLCYLTSITREDSPIGHGIYAWDTQSTSPVGALSFATNEEAHNIANLLSLDDEGLYYYVTEATISIH